MLSSYPIRFEIWHDCCRDDFHLNGKMEVPFKEGCANGVNCTWVLKEMLSELSFVCFLGIRLYQETLSFSPPPHPQWGTAAQAESKDPSVENPEL